MTSLPAHDMDPATNALRMDVREWFAKHWTPEKPAEHLRKPFKDRGWDGNSPSSWAATDGSGLDGGRSSAARAAAPANRSRSSPRWRTPGRRARRTAPASPSSRRRCSCTARKSNKTTGCPRFAAANDLRAGIQRAGGRLRPCRASHPRRPRRRRLGGQRPEAVVDRRRQGRLGLACGADRSGGEEARRHQRADGRSAFAGSHHPAEHGALRQDLQRAVL